MPVIAQDNACYTVYLCCNCNVHNNIGFLANAPRVFSLFLYFCVILTSLATNCSLKIENYAFYNSWVECYVQLSWLASYSYQTYCWFIFWFTSSCLPLPPENRISFLMNVLASEPTTLSTAGIESHPMSLDSLHKVAQILYMRALHGGCYPLQLGTMHGSPAKHTSSLLWKHSRTILEILDMLREDLISRLFLHVHPSSLIHPIRSPTWDSPMHFRNFVKVATVSGLGTRLPPTVHLISLQLVQPSTSLIIMCKNIKKSNVITILTLSVTKVNKSASDVTYFAIHMVTQQ